MRHYCFAAVALVTAVHASGPVFAQTDGGISTRLDFCGARQSLASKSNYGYVPVGDYRTRYDVAFGYGAPFSTFLRASSRDVSLNLLGRDSVSGLYSMSCHSTSHPWRQPRWLYGHDKTSLQWIGRPYQRVLQVSGISTGSAERRIGGVVTVDRWDPRDPYSPRGRLTNAGAVYTILLELQAQKVGQRGWRRVGRRHHRLGRQWEATRRELSLSGLVPPGAHHVRLAVYVWSWEGDHVPPRTPIALRIYEAGLTSTQSVQEIETQLSYLTWMAERTVETLNMRRVHHHALLGNIGAAVCTALKIVTALQEATERAQRKTFASPEQWLRDPKAASAYLLADEALRYAQSEGVISSDADRWDFYSERRMRVDEICQPQQAGDPDEAAFGAAGGKVALEGIANARGYRSNVAQFVELKERALGMIELIGATRRDYAWTALEY